MLSSHLMTQLSEWITFHLWFRVIRTRLIVTWDHSLRTSVMDLLNRMEMVITRHCKRIVNLGYSSWVYEGIIKLCGVMIIDIHKRKMNWSCFFRSGKSSIQKVVFHKMSPNETLFLESTNKIVKDDINNSSFVQFQIWDFPGQIDFFDPSFESESIFGGCGALVFVIDAQVSYF